MTVTFRPDRAVSSDQAGPRMQRAQGRSRVSFVRRGDETRLADLWQQGCAKVRLPRVHDDRGPVAVLINTAGGITGGDLVEVEAEWGEAARATVTGQAAERIYRSSAGVGRIRTRLVLADGANGAWLPQETIVFDRAGLDRRLDVTLGEGATFTGCEAVVLGRTAMGETVRGLDLVDGWRIRRGGRLSFADALRIRGDAVSTLAGAATGGGFAAFATVVHAATDAITRLDEVRAVLDEASGADFEAGASAFDGLIVARLLARDGRALRRGLEPLLAELVRGPLPRVWSI